LHLFRQAMRTLSRTALLVVPALLIVSCFYEREPAPAPQAPPPLTPAAGMVLSSTQAASVLAEARCDREARCNNIGPAAQYTTRDQCLFVMYDDSQRNLSGCRYGVKERELHGCVNEIRQQVCGPIVGPFEWFSRLIACRAAQICLQ
jgi:hypothetical protein